MTKPAKQPVKKSNAKAELAAGFEKIRKLKDEARKKSAGKRVDVNTPKKKPAKTIAVIVEPPLPKIVESKDAIEDIMARRVKVDGANLTLDKETTTGEYVRIFDQLTGYGEQFQLLIGDLIIQGEKLPAFGGKYTQAMLGTGRSLDSLKAYRSTAFHTPKPLRLLPYSHLHEVVKVPALEDKTRIIKDAAKAAKEGNMPSVKEIRAQADKCKPRKKKSKVTPAKPQKQAKVTRDLTVEENNALVDMEDAAARLANLVEGAAFLLEATTDATSTLREKLGRIAHFHAQLSA